MPVILFLLSLLSIWGCKSSSFNPELVNTSSNKEVSTNEDSDAVAADASASSSELSSEDKALGQSLDTYYTNLAKSDRFAGTILVKRGNQTIFKKSYGLATYPSGNANNNESIYGIGSVSKQFAAVAVLQLAEQGLLSLDDKLSKYLPYKDGDKMTLRQLLSHTSGVPDIEDVPNYFDYSQSDQSFQQVVDRLMNVGISYEPGSKHLYSSIGYLLATRVVEIVSKQNFPDYLSKNLLAKAGMTHSFIKARPQSSFASMPYQSDESGKPSEPSIHENHLIVSGAGGIFSTVEDMALWNLALDSGRLISSSSLQTMRTPIKEGYGLGIAIRQTEKETVTDHTGSINGYLSLNAFAPTSKLQIVVLTNFIANQDEAAVFGFADEKVFGAMPGANNSGGSSSDGGDSSSGNGNIGNSAKAAVSQLIQEGEIDPRWGNITPVVDGQKDFVDGPEWKIIFTNEFGTRLNLFLGQDGRYHGYNFEDP